MSQRYGLKTSTLQSNSARSSVSITTVQAANNDSEENGAPRIKRKRLSKREMQEKRKHMATKMRKFTGLTMR